MTESELIAAIALFRAEVEDLVSATNRRFYLDDGSIYPDDGRIETPGVAWASTAAVLAVIPLSLRTAYLTVNIAGTEYWFLPGDLTTLVPKVGNLSLIDGSVTLPKMADVATGTVFYRKTALSGLPEVQPLATLRTDLAIPDVSTKVDKITGYSLVANALIAAIHSPGSDDQDLTGKVDKVTDYSLVSDVEIARLALVGENARTITLPINGTLTGSVAAATDVPAGWVLSTVGGDLKIQHGLLKYASGVNVFYNSAGSSYRQYRNFADAYSGILNVDNNNLTIESITQDYTGYIIRIQILFE